MTHAELKRKLSKKGQKFIIVEHYIKPILTGQIREVNKIQSNGIFSTVFGEPDNPVSTANNGKGYWLPFEKASSWVFEGNLATSMTGDRKNFTMEIIEEV